MVSATFRFYEINPHVIDGALTAGLKGNAGGWKWDS
mgnify:CR=1 FL=1